MTTVQAFMKVRISNYATLILLRKEGAWGSRPPGYKLVGSHGYSLLHID